LYGWQRSKKKKKKEREGRDVLGYWWQWIVGAYWEEVE
jgi:hypothetical protein